MKKANLFSVLSLGLMVLSFFVDSKASEEDVREIVREEMSKRNEDEKGKT